MWPNEFNTKIENCFSPKIENVLHPKIKNVLHAEIENRSSPRNRESFFTLKSRIVLHPQIENVQSFTQIVDENGSITVRFLFHLSFTVWLFIDTAISVASLDNAGELKQRRDGIVERLYAATTAPPLCQNCEGGSLLTEGNQIRKQSNPSLSPEQNQHRRGGSSPPTPQSQGNDDEEDEEIDAYGGLFDDEQRRILEIKELLEDPRQTEDTLLESLQNLVDIDITFQELKETDIGRNVNQLRKHPSSDVRSLVKLLVKKWKEIVSDSFFNHVLGMIIFSC
ncbi:probable mediator of RNA polymerase II transcription subunit 26c [Vicia villosa]|uniref:probable mediator of RNA polymerase II transcription subunit 26c n=1 Tax=Vicia villosa TaxID=3911 RepID=UPI00273C5A45|nr:probable mediator of RNA polymerase II transcription subunit 26c [Vicia villosa]